MKSVVTKLIPKTVTSQLMALISVALILAQIVNLIVLIGENRLRARSYIVKYSIQRAIEGLQELPPMHQLALPYELRSRHLGHGAIYLAKQNRVSQLSDAERLERYERNLKEALKEQQIDFLGVEIALEPANNIAGDLPEASADDFPIKRRPPPPPRRAQDLRAGSRFIDEIEKHRDPKSEHLVISIELQAGVWFNASTPYIPEEPLTPRILIATISLLFITLLSVAFFMLRISRPLSEFARAADEFGRGRAAPILEEQGPDDVRQVAGAFNRMQRRLTRTLETQRTMLRAVGHDLRTPLTSLRIRSELIAERSQRDKFIATIDDMTLMTEDILGWAKNASGIEEVAPADLSALVGSVVDDFLDQGHDITVTEFPALILNIRRLGLKRALSNIITNAIKYAGSVKVIYESSGDSHNIHVDDQGEGIADELIADALKPFVRLESSRNKKTGGAGLGLSIAESILQADGGKLILTNLKPKGFRVTLSLPK